MLFLQSGNFPRDLKTPDERQNLGEAQSAQSDPSRPASPDEDAPYPCLPLGCRCLSSVSLWPPLPLDGERVRALGLLELLTPMEALRWFCRDTQTRADAAQPATYYKYSNTAACKVSKKNKLKKGTHVVFVLSYLHWVGIGCSLAGQAHWVGLGHGVVAVRPQQRVRMERRERQRVGALSSAGHVLWRL